MANVKYTLGGFCAGDFKAIEDYLNEQAAAGWALAGVGLLNKWRRTERTDLRWCVDLASPRQEREERQDYLALCAEGGWELAFLAGGMYFFTSRPGADAIPIQTDPILERKNYNRYYLKECILSVVIILAYIAFYTLMLYGTGGGWEEITAVLASHWRESWLLAAGVAVVPLWGIVVLWKITDFFGSLWRGRGERVPASPRPVMWMNGLSSALRVLGGILLGVALAAEYFLCGADNLTLPVMLACWAVFCLYRGFLYGEDLFPGERKRYRRVGAVLGAVLVLGIALYSVSPYGSDSGYRENSEGFARYASLEDKPVVKLEELGIDREERSFFRVTETVTPLGQEWLIEDYDFLWGMGCKSTLCFTKGQAVRLCARYVDEIARSAKNDEYHPMPGVELDSLSIGWADEAWYGAYQAADGDFSVLLVRMDKMVCRIIAPGGLTAEQIALAGERLMG